MKNEQNAPKIRFKGFTDAWELRKLHDLFTERNEQYPTSNDYPLMAFIANVGVASKGERYDRSALVKDEEGKKYKRTEKGDFIYSSNNLETGSIGLNNYGNACISPVYSVFKSKHNADADFLGRILLRKEFIHQMVQYRQGVVYGQWRIHESDFLNLGICVPPLAEQRQIGAYFRTLDHLITLHQRKCETLQKLKKSMLQKMFPKNGSCFPEIRFAGFTDAWEQRKFSDFTFPAGERNKDDLDLEPFAITSNQGFIAQSEAHDDFGYMKDVDRKMYIVVKPNSFAYNPARINVGSLGYYEGAENVIVSSLYEVFQTAEYVDDKFLKHWFKTKAFHDWIERLQEGSVRLYFYYDKLCECIMSMPSVEEQRKIGAYLDKIDNLITLHQRKQKKPFLSYNNHNIQA